MIRIFGFCNKKRCCNIGILVIVLGIALGACKTNGKTQKGNTPKHDSEMHFEKSLHAFGKVKAGETVGCYFSFTNTGEYPLVINMVKPGCGCTHVIYPEKPILPGEKGEIELRFDSKGLLGQQYKVIQIHANIKNKMKELVLSANVIN